MNRTNTAPSSPRFAPPLFGLLAVLLLACAGPATRAQEIGLEDGPVVERVQAAVRARILREQGGRDPLVSFNDDAQRYRVSINQIGVRGTGFFRRNSGRERDRRFSYEGVYNARRNTVQNETYRFEGGVVGGGDRDVPGWLRGSFRGRNPRSRRALTLSIDRDGDVVARYDDGGTDRGTYDGGLIRFGEALAWRVTRAGDGFDARDETMSRRAERFTRSYGGGDGGVGVVPDWAVGTFRGTTDSGESELSISPDGSATAHSITRNRSFTGRYEGGVLRFEFGSFNLERDGDGIRTIEVGNRRNQTSYRRVRNR